MIRSGLSLELLTSLPLAASSGGSLFPAPTSTTAGDVDDLFYFILAVSVVFFAIIVVAMFARLIHP